METYCRTSYQADQTMFYPVQSPYGFPIFSESVPQVYYLSDFAFPGPSRYYYHRLAEWSYNNGNPLQESEQGPNILSCFSYEPGEETAILDLYGEVDYSRGNGLQEPDQGSNFGSRISFAPEEGTAILDVDTADGFLSSFSRSTSVDLVVPLELVQEDRMNNDNSGLTEATISEHLKTRKYSTMANQSDQEPEICVVCQSKYENEETIGTLECRHEYHADCIKRWLMVINVCPVCRCEGIQQKR